MQQRPRIQPTKKWSGIDWFGKTPQNGKSGERMLSRFIGLPLLHKKLADANFGLSFVLGVAEFFGGHQGTQIHRLLQSRQRFAAPRWNPANKGSIENQCPGKILIGFRIPGIGGLELPLISQGPLVFHHGLTRRAQRIRFPSPAYRAPILDNSAALSRCDGGRSCIFSNAFCTHS
jgi:hypothetical protein